MFQLSGSQFAQPACDMLALCLPHLLEGSLLLQATDPWLSATGSPYHLRRSASHGIAQGVLAVPSVLAALVAAGPTGVC
jgi:hypothetical protein